MADNNKIGISFDEKSLEILNSIHPELRNASVNIAIKMLAKDPIYVSYLCKDCEDNMTEEEIESLANISNNKNTTTAQTATQPVVAQTSDWSDFM